MDALLNAIRTVAREDDAAIASFSGEVVALSPEARASVSERILLLQAETRSAGGGTSQPAVGPRATDQLAARRERSRRSARMWAGGGAVVFAAAAVLVLWTRPHPAGVGVGVGGDGALPGYAVNATGGVAEVRGPAPGSAAPEGRTAAEQHLRADSELRVGCRPDTAVAGPVAARAFFVQGQAVEEVKPAVEVAPTGAVALRLHGADLVAHHHGHGELRVVVGRPAAVASLAATAPLAHADGETAHWLTVPVDLETAPSDRGHVVDE